MTWGMGHFPDPPATDAEVLALRKLASATGRWLSMVTKYGQNGGAPGMIAAQEKARRRLMEWGAIADRQHPPTPRGYQSDHPETS